MGEHSRVLVGSCQLHMRGSSLSDEKMESARFGSGRIVAGAMSPPLHKIGNSSQSKRRASFSDQAHEAVAGRWQSKRRPLNLLSCCDAHTAHPLAGIRSNRGGAVLVHIVLWLSSRQWNLIDRGDS